MTPRSGTDRTAEAGGAGQLVPVGELAYTEASDELDAIVAELEEGMVDVDLLVARLKRATDIVDELDGRLRRTRSQVEELVPQLEAIGRSEPSGRAPAGDEEDEYLDFDEDEDEDGSGADPGLSAEPTGLF